MLRRQIAVTVVVLTAVSASACATTSAESSARSHTASAAGRLFTPEIGEIVTEASEKLRADEPDYEGAVADLDRAMAAGPNPYELGVALYMRGSARYQLDDVDGTQADWERALAEGDLNEAERLNLTYNIAQLSLSQGDYAAAADGIEAWIDQGGVATDDVHLNLVAAYVELDEWDDALGHARAAYDKADPRDARHYHTLHYLYSEMGMTEERDAILAETPDAYRPPGRPATP